jgi:hypothetical protein
MRVWLPLVQVLAACGGAVDSPGASSLLPPEARAALEQIYVDGHSYTLRADRYRDLMPGPAPTPKRCVGGTLFLRSDVESDSPQGLRADKTWLVNGPDIWETVRQPLPTFAVDRRNLLSLSVRDGPTWDTSAKVDVVLRFSTASGMYFIQKRGVQIIGAL